MTEILLGFLIPPALIGLLTIYHWLRPPPAPVDRSNVLNRVRLWWFALTRPDKFVPLFDWLRYDEWDNFYE